MDSSNLESPSGVVAIEDIKLPDDVDTTNKEENIEMDMEESNGADPDSSTIAGHNDNNTNISDNNNDNNKNDRDVLPRTMDDDDSREDVGNHRDRDRDRHHRHRHHHRRHRSPIDDDDDDNEELYSRGRRGNNHDDNGRDDYEVRSRAAGMNETYKESSTSTSLLGTTLDRTNIIYATNISPSVTLEQMRTFFSFLGDILNISLYHYDNSPESNFKVCFVEYAHRSSVLMAQHLTNTIFIDRAIFVLPYTNKSLKIPANKEEAEQELGNSMHEYVTNFNPEVATQVATGPGGAQVITTTDSRLTAASLQQYPQLPINTDPTRIEEIRRTLYIGNLDSSQPPEQVLMFFNDMGEVKYIRVAGDETQPTRFAFVEFTHQSSVANALLHNGFVFGSRALKINHSNNPIVKPQPKLEIEDPTKRMSLDGSRGMRDISGGRGSDRRHGGGGGGGGGGDSSRRRDRSRGHHHYHRDLSPRDRRHRSRSRDGDGPYGVGGGRGSSSRRRSRSRDGSSRRKSPDEIVRRRSRSRDSRKRRSGSRSSERRSSNKNKSRRR